MMTHIFHPLPPPNRVQKVHSSLRAQKRNLMMATDWQGRVFNKKKYSQRCQQMHSSDQFQRMNEINQDLTAGQRKSECKSKKSERKSKIEEKVEKIQNKFARTKIQNGQSEQKRNQLLIKIKMKDKNYFLNSLRSKLRTTSNLMKPVFPTQPYQHNSKSIDINHQLKCKQTYIDEATNLSKMVDGIHLYEAQRCQKSVRDKNMMKILEAMVGFNEEKVANHQAIEIKQKLYEKQVKNYRSIQQFFGAENLQKKRKQQPKRRKNRIQIQTKLLENKLNLHQNCHQPQIHAKVSNFNEQIQYLKGQNFFEKVGCISSKIKSTQDQMNSYFNVIGDDFITTEYLNLRRPFTFDSSNNKITKLRLSKLKQQKDQNGVDIVPQTLLVTLDRFYSKNKQKMFQGMPNFQVLTCRNSPLQLISKVGDGKQNSTSLFGRNDVRICQKMVKIQEKRKKNNKINILQVANRLSDSKVSSLKIGFGKIVQYF